MLQRHTTAQLNTLFITSNFAKKIALNALKYWHLLWSYEHLNALPLNRYTHIYQDIETEKPTVAIRPGLNSGAHILYYNVHQCECIQIFWYLSACQDTSIPFRMHLIKFVTHRLTVQLAGYHLHREICWHKQKKIILCAQLTRDLFAIATCKLLFFIHRIRLLHNILQQPT